MIYQLKKKKKKTESVRTSYEARYTDEIEVLRKQVIPLSILEISKNKKKKKGTKEKTVSAISKFRRVILAFSSSYKVE